MLSHGIKMDLQEKEKMEDECIESKQSTAVSPSSVSEGSSSSFLKSPGAVPTATVSPTHRFFLFTFLLSIVCV